VRGVQVQDWAYLDTGFEGFLIVPARIASNLGQPDLVSVWELGDGSLTQGTDYLGEVEIVGLAQTIPAQVTCLGDEWILGLGVLNHFHVVFDHGQSVEIRS
jgi:predicted aspartyl protease